MVESSRKVIIALPAYNEEPNLPDLLGRMDTALREMHIQYQVLIVDDGSTDRTYDIAAEWADKVPVSVRRHEENQGLGATLRDGLEWARDVAAPNDVIVTMDADNSHTPELIVRMIRMVREGHDVVVASRFQPGSRVRGVPLSRRVLSRLGSWLFKVTFPIKGIKDYTCGYRAYKAGVLQDALASDPEFFDQDGFQVMVDVLIKLRKRRDLIFGEVPLILRYDLKEGESKMDVGATITKTLSLMVHRRFR
ncbi:MAG: glycosyltransferase family 2 protein [Actinobacteria bacterium]|nr:MAG: glycosyltransferase family 2 protein [Actinomycetota bacterium]REK40616.1 MAG: glycosyltransferase family 2 protein [Actinomycetota bacterium]